MEERKPLIPVKELAKRYALFIISLFISALGASIAECTVVEDSAYCAETAHNAGFRVIGIYDPNTAPRGDVSQFADVFIRELAEFPD